MLPEGWGEVGRILVIQLDKPVDRVMSALQTLRQALPNAKITLMTTAASSQDSLPVDDRLIYGTAWQNASSQSLNPVQVQELSAKLRSHQFDAAVIFNNSFQSPYPLAYLCYLAGIPIRLGQSKEFGGSVLSHWVKPPPDENPVDRHLFLLESVDLAPRKYRSSSTVVTRIRAADSGEAS
jgi:ADP-heptose:LPS heptosyltransferase